VADLVFHSMPDSAYLWTAMHVADEKGVPYVWKALTYNSPEHLKLHPFGKMPVMQHGDIILYETAAIATYIDKAFEGPLLQPPDALGAADVIRWISIVNSYVFPVMNRFTKERIVRPAWGIEPDQPFIASAREPLAKQMQLIEATLAESSFLVGENITLADSFLLPHLLFFTLTREGAELLARSPSIKAWLDRIRARPSFARNPMRDAFAAMSAGVSRSAIASTVH